MATQRERVREEERVGLENIVCSEIHRYIHSVAGSHVSVQFGVHCFNQSAIFDRKLVRIRASCWQFECVVSVAGSHILV